MPRYADPDPDLPVIVTSIEARSAGLTRDQVRQRVRSGRWTALAHGVYRRESAAAREQLDEFAAARVDHAHRAIAAALAHPGCVVAFRSAALVHGLPLARGVPIEVDLIARPRAHVGRRPGLVVHRAELPNGAVVHHRVPVTSVARTWFDVARTRPLADALAVGDAALRAGSMSRNDVLQVMAEATARRGVRRARSAVAHLDEVRESVAESASWAYFVTHRLPLPRAQIEVRSRVGAFLARVDFWWEHARLVGECDGRLKYESADDLYREKRREDALRAEGMGVVRWSWTDLRDPRLAARLRRLLT